MLHIIPVDLLIEEERKRRHEEEGRRAYLELPLPTRRPQPVEAPIKAPSRVEIIDIYGDEEDEERDGGVVIIDIFGD